MLPLSGEFAKAKRLKFLAASDHIALGRQKIFNFSIIAVSFRTTTQKSRFVRENLHRVP
jgi:hypothetical protein